MKYTMFYPLGFEGISCNSVAFIRAYLDTFLKTLFLTSIKIEALNWTSTYSIFISAKEILQAA